METTEKIEAFKYEMNLISDPHVRNFTREAIATMPDYFFEIPASSTGKYHPSYALGPGGLLRHTRAAVLIAAELFNNDTVTGRFSDYQKSVIIAALILHDGAKSGIPKTQYTISNHPVVMAEHLRDNIADFLDVRNDVIALISTHMGEWNTDRDGVVVAPRPATAMERFVHMCDYLASRKSIEVKLVGA